MRKITFLLLSSVLIAGTAYAGGSIFKHKSKKVNTYGVHSIGVHVCGNLECPPVRIVEGTCDGEHMSKHWGVCVCEAGYVAEGTNCVACPEGQYSDGIHGCQSCPEGTYRKNSTDTQCTQCPELEECSAGDECCTMNGPEDVCGRKTRDMGFKDWGEECHSCFSEDNIETESYECARCPNREYIDMDMLCSPTKCEGFRDYGGNCYDCNEQRGIYSFYCDKCPNREETEYGTCALKPENCNGIFDKNGNCYSCDEPKPFETDNCATCYNREQLGNYCVLKPEYCTGFIDNEGICHQCDGSEECDPTAVYCAINAGNCSGCQTCQQGKCVDTNTQCPDNGTCTNGYCSDCPKGDSCGTQCCTEGMYCSGQMDANSFSCVAGTGSCTKNSDCNDENKYCKFKNCNASGWQAPTEGECTDKGTLNNSIEWNGRTFYIGESMNWWSAENFCLAHGKKMANPVSLGLSPGYHRDSC